MVKWESGELWVMQSFSCVNNHPDRIHGIIQPYTFCEHIPLQWNLMEDKVYGSDDEWVWAERTATKVSASSALELATSRMQPRETTSSQKSLCQVRQTYLSSVFLSENCLDLHCCCFVGPSWRRGRGELVSFKFNGREEHTLELAKVSHNNL